MASADRLIELFNEAKARPAGAERERFLAEACLGEPELKEQVISLLQARERAGDFLKNTLVLSPGAWAPPTIRYFGDYQLLEEIARGGMGVVYKARQISLNRLVAVKVLVAGKFSSPEFVQRFRIEAKAAANLQHPNIVAIHEVGEHEGQQYFSMDYVEGQDLAELAREQPLPARRAAAYLKTIAEAVHYAHQRGVIHRDLKPSNVLLDPNDQPRVTDFGVAKLVGTGSTPSHSISEEVTNAVERVPTTDLTVTGQVIGTPAYMPPEQAAARHAELGPASDVYSLGAILYYLLTGRPPFAAETVHATLNQVLHSDPVSPRVLNPGLPRDLETVCLKCLEKEPPRRYRSARELVEELGRFLRDEPIHARAATPLDRVFKWTKRHPAVAALMGLVILVSAAGFSGVLWQWRQAADARGIAVGKAAAATKARENAEYESYVSKIALAASQLDRGALARAGEELGRCPLPLRHWEWAWLKQQCDSGPRISEGHIGEVLDIRFSAERQHALIRSRHSARIWDLERDREGELAAPFLETRFASFLRNPAEALVLDGSEFSFWSLENGQRLRKIRLGADAGERIDHVCATGERAFTASLNVYDTASGQLLAVLQPAGRPAQIKAVSADGRRALTAGQRLELWDTDTGRSVFAWPANSNNFEYAVFSPDARKLFTQTYSGGASTRRRSLAGVWDADTGRLIASLRTRGPSTVESTLNAIFAPDSRRLLTLRGNSQPVAEVWEPETGRLVTTFEGHTNPVPNRISAMAFSPDGRRVCTAGYDRLAKVWDAATGVELKTLAGHLGLIECVAFSPDGSYVATGGTDKSARLWDLRAGKAVFELSNAPPRLSWATFSPSGREVVGFDRPFGPTNSVGIWDARTGEQLGTLEPGEITRNAAVSRAGSRLVTIHPESIGTSRTRSVARLWELPSLRLMHSLTSGTFTISADATRMLGLERTPASQQPAVRDRRRGDSSAAPSYTARLWETDGGTLLASVGPTNHVLVVTIDGEHCCKWGVHAGTYSPELQILAAETGKVIGRSTNVHKLERAYVLPKAAHAIVFGEFANDSPAQGPTPALLLMDLRTGRDRPIFVGRTLGRNRAWPAAGPPREGLQRPICELWSFATGGRRVLLGDGGNSLWLLDVEGAGRVVELVGHAGVVRSAALFSDDRRVLTGSEDCTAKIWDAETGRELLSLPHSAAVTAVAVSPDGQSLFTFANDTARIWTPTITVPASFGGSNARWHDQEAEASEAAKDWFGALFHLERLLKAVPGDDAVRKRYSSACLAYTNLLQSATNGSAVAARIPPRDPATKSSLIDLADYYTAPLVGTWLPHPPAEKHPNDLAPLPGGVQTLAGTEFDVRGVVQLSGAFLRREDRAYPEKVVNIFTGRKCRRLHFLHAAGWAGTLQTNADGSKREALTVPFGTALGHYVVRFVNGDSHEVPIVHGRDVREWWHWPESVADPKELVVAWTGTNAANRASNTSIRLFKSTWPNPHPNLEIASIDFISAMSQPAPFLIAITAE